MSDLGRGIGAIIVTAALGAGAIYGADWAREQGYLPEPAPDAIAALPEEEEAGAEDTASDPTAGEGEAPPELTGELEAPVMPAPQRDFVYGEGSVAIDLGQVNALCAHDGTISTSQTFLAIAGDGPGTLLIHRIPNGNNGVLERYSAPADQLHAFARQGEVTILRANGRFDARTFLVDETGEPTFSEPLFNGASEVFYCPNGAEAAAAELNALFAENGSTVDPVSAALQAFVINGERWEGTQDDRLASACGTASADTAIDGRWILGTTLREFQSWDESIINDAGEAPSGVEVFLDVDVAWRGADGAEIVRYSLPMNEGADFPSTTNGFGPYFRWPAIAVRSFGINEDGSRAHSLEGDPQQGVDIPCRDIAVGEAAFREVRGY